MKFESEMRIKGGSLHFLVTGHTGFKGSWLVLLLKQLGHQVSGIALDPVEGSLFQAANIGELLEHDIRMDIRDVAGMKKAIGIVQPDVVMHLAAQALVRESYLDPRFTFETNVMGTLNVLEAAAAEDAIQAVLVITTDKVYRNINQTAGYLENDPLGGDDPYSSSKAMADLLCQSWVKSYPGHPTAIARGGNVIGGGDVSKDRLLVDLVRSFSAGYPTKIRYPDAVRPWQHVLDCLSGYLAIVTDLLNTSQRLTWNIGPLESSFISVGAMADDAARYWGGKASWQRDEDIHPHEAGLLMLNSDAARSLLNWRDRIPYPQSLHWTLDWYKAVDGGVHPRAASIAQIDAFIALASE